MFIKVMNSQQNNGTEISLYCLVDGREIGLLAVVANNIWKHLNIDFKMWYLFMWTHLKTCIY